MRIDVSNRIAVLLGMALMAGSLAAQTPRPPALETNLPAQKLGPNDLIFVSVYDEPGLSRSARVSDDGYIRLPMLKERVKVQGLMPAEVELAVATALKKAEVLVDPVVTVTVAEYSSRPVSVVGCVRAPTTFQASEPVTLLEAIARAGGLTNDAGLEILVSRKARSESGQQDQTLVKRIPVKELLEGTDSEYNLLLTGGEEIRVPEISKLYVVGNVKKPGAFAIQEGGETTVLQILALSEGLLPYSGKTAYVYRREGQGLKNEIEIPLHKILDRKAPDVQLTANDILYIPDNRGKKTTSAILERVLSFGVGTLSGVIIYRSIH